MRGVILLLTCLPLGAVAQNTTSSNLSNSATVLSSCTLRTTQNINFGGWNPLTELSKTANGAVGLSCTKGSYALTVDYGSNSYLGTKTNAKAENSCFNNTCWVVQSYNYTCARKMAKGSDTIVYEVYTNAALTQTPTNPTYSVSYTVGSPDPSTCSNRSAAYSTVTFNSAQEATVPVYARATGTKSTAVGVYSDTLRVTVTF